MAEPETTRVIYDRLADRYDRALAPWEKWFLRRWRAETLAHLPPNARVLEIGAGTGLNFAHYPLGTTGVASELSCRMLAVAAEKDRPAAVELVQCSADTLPFGDHSFDAACATLVLCSVPSQATVFAELRRVIRPGGAIVLLEHVRPDGPLGPVFDLLNWFTVRLFEDHFNRRTAENAAAAGLQVVSIKKHGFGAVNVLTCRA